MRPATDRGIALGITGASGAPYWRRLLEVLLRADHTVHLCSSDNADQVARVELGVSMDECLAEVTEAADGRGRLVRYGAKDFDSPLASGGARLGGMAIVPCSMGTLGRIATGASSDLLSRAADVALKERRQLILLVRETPLNLVHLENMATLSRAGAVIMPASPGFYHRPAGIYGLIDFMVQRICDHLDVPVDLTMRWGEQ